MRILMLWVGLSLVLWGCERKEIKAPEEAMRAANSPSILDELPREPLIANIDQQITYLTRTEPRGNLLFGPKAISRPAYVAALKDLKAFLESKPGRQDLQDYLHQQFQFYEVYGSERWGEVRLTSYYLPIIPGNKKKSEPYTMPLVQRPKDLIRIQTKKFWDPIDQIRTMRGRFSDSSQTDLIPYFDRAEIMAGALPLDKLALCYVELLEAFWAQIQGSVTVKLATGGILRLGYADQNGHPYVPIGKFLFDKIPKEEMSKDRIDSYLKSLSKEEQEAFLNQNPSFVFFRELTGEALTANNTPVVDGRTIATDPKFFPKGALAYLAYNHPQKSFDPSGQLVFDQDTGGAITGPGRVDLFWGKGPDAGFIAGQVNQTAKLWYLVPR